MALAVQEIKELNNIKNLDELKEMERQRRLNRTNVLIVLLLVLLLLLICIRISTIGFNSVEAWEIDKIELTNENLLIANDTKINVFGGLNRLAPMSSGTYRFSVKNNSSFDIIYNIKFEHDMRNYINMKYRLKMDNIYIKGNSDEYVDINDLNVENIIVPKQSVNVYTLEWYWENDDENDTKMGAADDPSYYFKMQITSNIYEK